jgi:hypothetical protein
MEKLLKIIQETKENINNAPTEYPINIIIKGKDAASLHFLLSVYTSYFENFTEEDILRYLLRQTVLQEFSKLSDYEQIQHPANSNQP